MYISKQMTNKDDFGINGLGINIDGNLSSMNDLIEENQTLDITSYTITNCILPIGLQYMIADLLNSSLNINFDDQLVMFKGLIDNIKELSVDKLLSNILDNSNIQLDQIEKNGSLVIGGFTSLSIVVVLFTLLGVLF